MSLIPLRCVIIHCPRPGITPTQRALRAWYVLTAWLFIATTAHSFIPGPYAYFLTLGHFMAALISSVFLLFAWTDNKSLL